MNTPKTPAEGLGDVDEALAASADLRSPFGSGDGPVVELFDSGVPGRIVAHMPSGPLDGKVDFISYLDLDAPLVGLEGTGTQSLSRLAERIAHDEGLTLGQIAHRERIDRPPARSLDQRIHHRLDGRPVRTPELLTEPGSHGFRIGSPAHGEGVQPSKSPFEGLASTNGVSWAAA